MGLHKVLLTDLAKKIAADHGTTQAATLAIISATLSEIKAAVASGEEVFLGKFGSFYVKPTNARTARNPQTGAAIEVPAGKRVAFRVSQQFLQD